VSQVQVVTVPRRSGRAQLAFGIVGIVAGLIAGGAIYYRQVTTDTPGPSPEQTVELFLAAIFEPEGGPEKVAPLVCEGWEPEAAIARVKSGLPRFVSVEWREIAVLSRDEGRAVVGATFALTPFLNPAPTDFPLWTFNLVDEEGWRVCEAQPVL
jgi:hypothetical protein